MEEKCIKRVILSVYLDMKIIRLISPQIMEMYGSMRVHLNSKERKNLEQLRNLQVQRIKKHF
jgi:hypothetical protein